MIRVAMLTIGASCALFGQAFEVASVKPAEWDPKAKVCMCESPGTVGYRLTPLKYIIRRAYNLQDLQVVGPDWLMSERFNIDAKLPRGASMKELPAMMKTLLAERFKLAAHTDTKELAGFALVVSKGGSKLIPAKSGNGFATPMDRAGKHLKGTLDIHTLVGLLSEQLGRPVLDETGLTGIFTIALDFAPDSLVEAQSGGDVVLAPPLPAALQEQLGLKLEPRKTPVEILVIDHIERVPVEN